MPNKNLKLAIVGCGGMAHGHLNGYMRIKEKEPGKFMFAAMCDPVAERAQKFADEAAQTQDSAPKVYTDLDEMLKNEDLDAADICSRHSDHHVNGIACLDAGVNIMIEKPFGVTIKASKLIIEAAKRNGKIAATAENIRRGLSQRTAHWLINERKMIGEPRMFFSQMAAWRAPEPGNWHWRLDHMLGGGGMVMDSGAHFCDTLRFLFGDVDTVYAEVEQLEDRKANKEGQLVRNDQEDTWAATITFKSGLIGLWTCTWSAPGHSFTKVVYYGSEGSLLDQGDIFHGPREGAEVILKDGKTMPMAELQKEFLESLGEEKRNRLFPHGFMDGVTIECYDLLDAIENDRQPEVTGEVGMKAKTICESIFESGFSGQAVKYDDVLAGKVDAYQRPIDEHWGI
jgi:UDP-N-acetyl-2-amino-2-deoxyglucuronate dehydrogenase